MENEELLPKPLTDLPLPEKEIPAHTGASKTNIFKSKFFLGFVAFSILIAFLIGGFYLGRNSVFKELNPSNPTIPPKDPDMYKGTPAPDPTAEWKTYTNTAYGYSLKYPGNYSIAKGPAENRPDEDFQTDDQISFSGDQIEEDSNYGTSLSIQANPSDRNGRKIICASSEDCINKYRLNALTPSPENTEKITKNIDNQTFAGFRYKTTNPLYAQDSTYLSLYGDETFFLISYTLNNESNDKLEKTVEQILSTFKFTNSSPAKDATGKICGDEYLMADGGNPCPSGYSCDFSDPGNGPGKCIKE